MNFCMRKFYWKSKEFIIPIILILSMFLVFYIYNYKLYEIDKDYTKIDLDNINNLMIVAHPDDDILWGGAHLIQDNYLVVCVTCGVNKTRVKEFINVMNETDDQYIMLGYPDKTNGERDNWDTVREDIINDIKDIIDLKDWNIIVTHNPEGEYGHIHHIMTSNITSDLVSNKDTLYYFGKYYSKKKINDHIDEMNSIDDDILKIKQNIIKLYESQSFIQTKFDHMNAYEEWLNYNEWMDLYEESN